MDQTCIDSGKPSLGRDASAPASSLRHRGRVVHELFEEQAVRSGDAVAIMTPEIRLSYAELNQRADQLASRLHQLGLGTRGRVGICLPRCPESIISILGVLKTGAAYVPLDPEYPADRLQWMMADAQLSALITADSSPSWTRESNLPTICVTSVWLQVEGSIEPATESSVGSRVGPDDVAYLMYTSGSTGKPKGVAVPHRGIVRLVCSPDFVDIGPDDVFLQMAPISFDASTFEIWGALLNGARLALMPPGPAALEDIGSVIRRENVTILWLTGGLFNLMVDERLDDLRPVRQLLVGGEVLSVAHVEKARAHLPDTQLINGYGPTENTTFTCCHRIQKGEKFARGVPIGRPIRSTTVKVVDEQLREVAPMEAGELITGGDGLALGYWNRPELTAGRFVHLSLGSGDSGRFYRTGDYVRQREDGVIEFLGRRDQQVKLRGYRIEMGEIEAGIRNHPAVRDCAVNVADAGSQQTFLVAYVVLKPNSIVSDEDLAKHVAQSLPEHMRPRVWQFLDRLPLNPNGKVDRGMLPAPRFGESDRECRGDGATGIELKVAEIWQQILGGRRVARDSTFFEAGGNSLSVTRLHDRLTRELGVNLPLVDFFQFPSVRRLAEHLAARQGATEKPAADGQQSRGESQRRALDHFRNKQRR